MLLYVYILLPCANAYYHNHDSRLCLSVFSAKVNAQNRAQYGKELTESIKEDLIKGSN